ncbi:hypothetical protein MYX06_00070 [Patescibacteria group bacterium AH-259-L05]|nr:hypothetical protein [Patescibacteria group bacterium AH-259-L05]
MSQSETKICQNCKQQFIIEPDDFDFYEKIQVPPPTFCPQCRMTRRMMYYINVFCRIYKRVCDATGKELISIYPSNTPYPVYDRLYWFSDNWDSLVYGKEYDFLKPFFVQLNELQKQVPRYHTYNVNSINCEYCAAVTNSRNCYMSSGFGSEDCIFSIVVKSKRCVDSWFVTECELCYFCNNCDRCYKVLFSQYADHCIESAFLYNCVNCSYCFGCVNLKNKSYHIFNNPYTQKDYFKKLDELEMGSFNEILKLKERFEGLKLNSPHRFAKVVNSLNVTGDRIRNTKNCFNCFETYGVEDCRYATLVGLGISDSYDVFDAGSKSSLLYEGSGCSRGLSRSAFNNWITGEGLGVYYSDICIGSSHLFGCVGLCYKSYCILNKQYSKQEYEKLVPQIIQHMNDMPYIDKKGRVYKYGEFFPAELSPFAYNETIAQEYFPLTKQQAIEQGYRWKAPDTKNYKIQIPNDKLPDHIKDVGDDIIGKTIQCAHAGISDNLRLSASCNEQCTTAFKFIPDELQFYKKMNLPLPRLCPNCRHYQRLKQRNPLKLWHRTCQCAGEKSDDKVYQNTIKHFHGTNHCPNEFETTYSPNRPEIVYCEKCYQNEVV